ncbi:hypothetical protein SOVF_177940 [Spinacia oleracea]|nr:hypothetical protein SOVF_177940 [Spinacia oleracea]
MALRYLHDCYGSSKTSNLGGGELYNSRVISSVS